MSPHLELSETRNVLTAEDTTAYTIRRIDWRRIRRHVEQIASPDSTYQNAAWTSFGVAATTLFAFLTFWQATEDRAAWILPTCLVLFVAALLIGFLCLKMARDNQSAVTTSRKLCLEEMDELEGIFYRDEEPEGEESTQDVQWGPILRALLDSPLPLDFELEEEGGEQQDE